MLVGCFLPCLDESLLYARHCVRLLRSNEDSDIAHGYKVASIVLKTYRKIYDVLSGSEALDQFLL